MSIPESAVRLPFSAMPDLGYDDPVGMILRREKKHTLRKTRVNTRYREVVANGKRTGIILEITGCYPMTPDEYLTNEFARADGLRDAQAMAEITRRFYGEPPDPMWRIEFEVARAPAELVERANRNDQEAMEL